MKCIIIDDEPLARAEMEVLIQKNSNLEVSAKFSNALTALQYLEKHTIDLLFLDIEMPGLNGIELAAKLPKDCLVIFTTAYPQYAVKSYELDAIDYLLKPIDNSRLEKAIRKAELYRTLLNEKTAKSTFEWKTDDFIFIQSDRRTYKVDFNNVIYIEALKDYVVIYTTTQKLITAMNLKTMYQKLPMEKFIRVSRSFIVNLSQVTSFDNHWVYINELDIPMGEIYRSDFISRYFKGGSK
jgi:DNA-binding LytR/AlgR family response regulator